MLKSSPEQTTLRGRQQPSRDFAGLVAVSKPHLSHFLPEQARTGGLAAERGVGLDSTTNLPSALVMSLGPVFMSPLCRQDYCFCASGGVSLGRDKGARFLF